MTEGRNGESATSMLRKVATDPIAIWVYRLAVIAVFFWAKSNFVSKDDYKSDQKMAADLRQSDKDKSDQRYETQNAVLGGINNTLTRIDEKMKNDQRQDDRMNDFEVRIRSLEGFHVKRTN